MKAQILLFPLLLTGCAHFGNSETEDAWDIQQVNCEMRTPHEMGELDDLAVDIARRVLLAQTPHAGKNPIFTEEVRVRPEGDAIHTYARLRYATSTRSPRKMFTAEVFASMIYTPEVRRVYDISYKDNRLFPRRLFNRKIDLLSKINEEFERRDEMIMPMPLIGNRMDLLLPRGEAWQKHNLSDDHAWHVYSADDHIGRRWADAEAEKPQR